MRRLRVPEYWSGVPEIVDHTYGETVVFRDGVAEVQTDAAYDYLVNLGYVPVGEPEAVKEGAGIGVCGAKRGQGLAGHNR
jgi:hypothetical protein